MSSPFNSPLPTDSIQSGASIAPMPNRMSLPHGGWHPYVPTPSSSACDSDPSNDVGAYPLGEPISTAAIQQSVNHVGQGHDGLGFAIPNATQFPSSDPYHHQMYLAGSQVKQGGFSPHAHHQAQPSMVGQPRSMAVSASTMGYEASISTAAGQVQQQGQEFQGPLHPTMIHSQSTTAHLNYHWDSRT